MTRSTPKIKKEKIILAEEIQTIVVDGSVINTGPEIFRMIPVTRTPREVIEKKATTELIGNTDLVFTKRAAKGLREALDKWLKEVEKK